MLATSSYNNIDKLDSPEIRPITESDQEVNEIASELGDSLIELELQNINFTETDPSTNRVTTDLVRLYLQDIGRVPLLTKEEEVSKSRQVQRYVELLEIRNQAAENDDEIMKQFVQVHGIHDQLMAYLGHRPSWEKWAKASEVSVFELKEILVQGKSQWAVLANMDVAELEEIQKSGIKAKDEMIKANLRLVVSVAKKYQHRGLELLDLIQEGTLGLEKAVEKFDPVKGYRFSTYAYWWIRQGITRAIATQSRIIRLPVHVTEKLNKIKQVQRKISQSKNRNASLEEIGQELGMTAAQVREVLMKIPRSVSLEVKVGKEKDTELVDLLESEDISPEENLAVESLRRDIGVLLKDLTEREQQVIKLRYGFEDGVAYSLADIGRALELSRERVRQIEAKALQKLRQPRRRNQIRDYFESLT
ncbi:MAG: RNA polymerase sigma factor SigC [Crocosphaera sp.]|uniref:RNA polymerase sigma factor n=5 Tax=Crocosphaera watsonii TaxID=263511 RepID=G5IXY9_CROWT|nr:MULTISPECIES: RNA polymerase sigma factor SigC [Crocosphaera]EHJ15189.1 Group 2 RNA polymerase sigma factor @ Cyanobacteria-specific RpoD-like sigma factor, type-7 [Crocosphaera watsonii WH 0003]MCH2243236.1 RNA polymerase sigma factor SigC [Crocosphaera sp.]NQZ63817.1 RNA polymerase sigma factor SigC [Crocosphaera sp.]CCQ56650.1 Group 2 RNA polymerase sigma factor @ Cyanobacteria-specific RpoD-like sigma factor, type-7 [Crocosphaera watsonii WH 0005]